MIQTSEIFQNILTNFKAERAKTDNFLLRTRGCYTDNYKVIPEKAMKLLKQESELEKILHPITTDNLDKIGIVTVKNLDLFIEKFKEFHKKIRGLPQFMIHFLEGKACQEKELFFKNPSQTSLVECDNHHFLIRSNPTYDDISFKDTVEKTKLFGQFTIPPRLCVWFIHKSYLDKKDNYPILKALTDDDFKKDYLKELKLLYHNDNASLRYGEEGSLERTVSDKQQDTNLAHHLRRFTFSKSSTRNSSHPTNQELERETGNQYLASIFFLEPEQHLDMLKQLKNECLQHLETTYGISQQTHPELDLYFHYPTLERTSTLHLHIVCKKIPTELNKISIDDIIEDFENKMGIQHTLKKLYKKFDSLPLDPEADKIADCIAIAGVNNVTAGKVMFAPQDS